MVLKVEKQKDNNIQFGDPVEQSIHLMKFGSHGHNNAPRYSKKNKDGDKYFSYCKEHNHVKDNCFKLIGYPKFWKGKKKTTQKGEAPKNSHYAANVMALPFDANDSEDEKNYAPKSDFDMSGPIQKELLKK